MRVQRNTPEQVGRRLPDADRMLNERTFQPVFRRLQVPEQTYPRWCNQNGTMRADDAKGAKNWTYSAITASVTESIPASRSESSALSRYRSARAVGAV
jgi:hypothetical protein